MSGSQIKYLSKATQWRVRLIKRTPGHLKEPPLPTVRGKWPMASSVMVTID